MDAGGAYWRSRGAKTKFESEMQFSPLLRQYAGSITIFGFFLQRKKFPRSGKKKRYCVKLQLKRVKISLIFILLI
jgi:hypothetical protein